jgi:DNA-binding NarL/FixJ family response regulator
MSIRLLIADGQEVARLGLRSFLAGTEVEVCAEADDGKQAVQLALSSRPDVVLMALRMPGEDGLSALRRIKQKRPKLPVIMMAHEDHPAHLAQAYGCGASGCLLKSVDPQALSATIRAVASGKPFWNRMDVRRVTGVSTSPRLPADAEAPLTPREVDVLREVTEGRTNEQIAARLGIRYETVKEHVQHVLQRIGVNDRTQAAIWAVRNGLV